MGVDGDIVNFRGIPYATLKDRLAEAQLLDQYDPPVDARHYGPVSPCPSGAFQLEMSMMQQSLPEPHVTPSGLHALNLNITVPKSNGTLPPAGKLPVFVWIHGGGFVSGANSWPQYDMTRLVRFSAESKTPIIGVCINFRLGFLGFLTSDELRTFGYKANNQLRDQTVALEWIRKFIAGFGGDGSNITVAGESAGGVDVGLHLQSQKPRFERAIMTGGSSLLMAPTTVEQQERVYTRVIEALALESAAPSDRIRSLCTLPLAEIMERLPPATSFVPMIDGELVPFAATYAMVSDRHSQEISGKRWLKGLMVGDCQFDASSMAIFMGHHKMGISQNFPSHIRRVLTQDQSAIDELLGAYGLTSDFSDDDVAFRGFMNFINDLAYYAATVAFARGWPTACHVHFVNERNPGKGMFQGEATHIMDVILLFQNFNENLPPAMAKAAVQLAVDVFEFMNGHSPWPRCTDRKQSAKVYGPSSWDPKVDTPSIKIIDDLLSPDSGRRRTMIDIGDRIGFDNLAKALAGFLAS
ncbi:Carboxylic ester hydrolase [Pleurostoma richardsiae]|uniref:Carboxylic ester hydrolase n=1 Tax=Pleurostoma richardsiae TaxID=41990 RepID=A0AA38VBJ6_9PEZI|nr:Carboxylic ester hydrolase [Pleurostoma richardsiae]